jgi:adenine-specific DNA-methyltransferase
MAPASKPDAPKRKDKQQSHPDTEPEDFSLEVQSVPAEALKPNPKQSGLQLRTNVSVRGGKKEEARLLSYRHQEKRKNNPQVGLVNEANDPQQPKTEWRYDPHIDPALQFDVGRAQIEKLIDDALASGDQAAMRAALEELKRAGSPYLNWAGKAERTSFDIDTVSLHVHERIDPMSILAAVSKRIRDAKGGKGALGPDLQMGLFSAPFENLPLRDAIDFYKHERGWANRLIAGDSLLVMNSLLQKESMAGQVQMIYIDPPYGIRYGSNFQPFVGKRDVKDRKDEDLTQEPEMIKAFRDTWELGIHSYLTYLRDRLLLARGLLSESGSIFVQISDENLHHVRELLDEIFGKDSFVAIVNFKSMMPLESGRIESVFDYVVWYAKDSKMVKYRNLYSPKDSSSASEFVFCDVGTSYRKLSVDERRSEDKLSQKRRIFKRSDLASSGYTPSCTFDLEFSGELIAPVHGKSWRTTRDGISRLTKANRLFRLGRKLYYKLYLNDFGLNSLTNSWTDTIAFDAKLYVVQTTPTVLERCLLMTTDPGDLVLDPTCGSGTTAFVAEKWGRRWITCDTSRVAVTLAKQRLMTASYDYYELRYPHEGLRGGFIYRTVAHVTLKSIANNPDIDEIYRRAHPAIELALAALNSALQKQPPVDRFVVTDGGRIGEKVNFAKGGALREWEVPFDAPEQWPKAAKNTVDAFHATRQAMQQKMDDAVATHAESETLYDRPERSKSKLRISGPFTVEAVPFATVLSLDEVEQPREPDVAIARSGESARQHSWRDELLKTGIRGKSGQMLKFSSLETLPGTVCLHASGTLDSGERVVVSFGPEHAALEQRQVEHAMREAGELFPLPKMIVFCAFAFDSEAAKDIDAMKGISALKAQMNTDLLTDDLKKGRSSNQSFWLMGQPDVDLRRNKDGTYVIEVNGFDYFDTTKGELVSGGKAKIAMWLLDTDYDDRSLFPRQVFFPMAGRGDGWEKLKRDIRAELDDSQLDKFHGTISLPFVAGDNRKVAIKIVDDRGIESLKIIALGKPV